LLRQNGDVALISYKLRKTVKRSLSVAHSLGEAPSWLMSIQRDFSGARVPAFRRDDARRDGQ
jgi:hypothetical protein